MDPTMPGAVSPYQTSTAPAPGAGGAISPTQLQAILAALKQQVIQYLLFFFWR